MNEYLVHVNGVLMPTGMFSGRTANAAVGGKFLLMSCDAERMKQELGKNKIRRLDVVEVRASKTVKRYVYERPSADESGKVNDENFSSVEGQLRFRCWGSASSF